MTDPERAARLWLVIAVATLWAVSVGRAAEATLTASGLDAWPDLHGTRRRARLASRPHLLSCFRHGVLTILAALIAGHALPLGRFYPTSWPESAHAAQSLSAGGLAA